MTDIIKCTSYKLHEPLEILKKSAKNSNVQYKHSACLIRGYKILTIGVNKYHQDKQFTIHAEIDAILKYDTKDLKGMDILTIRISNSSDNLCNSRPCNSCIDKLKQRGVRKAYYSTDNGDVVYEYVDIMPKLHISSGTRYRNLCGYHIS